MTMAASVEARLPFLHGPLLDFIPSVSPRLKTRHGVTKYILRRVARDLLPETVSQRPKSAIKVPIHQWMGELADSMSDIAANSSGRIRKIFKPEAIEHIVKCGRSGKDPYSARQLFGLVVLELWWRIFLDPEQWECRPRDLETILS